MGYQTNPRSAAADLRACAKNLSDRALVNTLRDIADLLDGIGAPPWPMLSAQLQNVREGLRESENGAQLDQLIATLRTEIGKFIHLDNADQRYGVLVGATVIGALAGSEQVSLSQAVAIVLASSLEWMTEAERASIPGLG